VGRYKRKGHFRGKRHGARIFLNSQRYVGPSAGDWDDVKRQLAVTAALR
jgi:hypothetical protein